MTATPEEADFLRRLANAAEDAAEEYAWWRYAARWHLRWFAADLRLTAGLLDGRRSSAP